MSAQATASLSFWNVFSIVALFLCTCWILRFIILSWRKRSHQNVLLETFVDSALSSFLWMIFSFGIIKAIRFSLQWAKKNNQEAFLSPLFAIEPYLELLIIILVTYLLLSWKDRIFQHYRSSPKLLQTYEAVLPTFEKLTSIFICFLGAYWSLTQFDIDLSVLFAVGGIGGLATGFAAKDVVANFFGGFVILINRPFKAGDLVKSPNRNFEGFVDEIGFYSTRLKTLDRFPIYIPNGLLTEAIIENSSRRSHRRLKTSIGIRYCDFNKLPSITSSINQALEEDARVDKNLICSARFSNFGDSSLEIDIIAHFKTLSLKEWREVREEFLLKVGSLIEEQGAEIAFPTRTLYVEQSSSTS